MFLYCIGATLLGEASSPATVDIMPILMELKFEPHHRNFVRNLYENQMLVRSTRCLDSLPCMTRVAALKKACIC